LISCRRIEEDRGADVQVERELELRVVEPEARIFVGSQIAPGWWRSVRRRIGLRPAGRRMEQGGENGCGEDDGAAQHELLRTGHAVSS
jgi:hypothetical protein